MHRQTCHDCNIFCPGSSVNTQPLRHAEARLFHSVPVLPVCVDRTNTVTFRLEAAKYQLINATLLCT